MANLSAPTTHTLAGGGWREKTLFPLYAASESNTPGLLILPEAVKFKKTDQPQTNLMIQESPEEVPRHSDCPAARRLSRKVPTPEPRDSPDPQVGGGAGRPDGQDL